MIVETMDDAWHGTLYECFHFGDEVSPRGMKIRELQHHTIAVDMNHPVLRWPDRKLNYKFMAAEALWMINGQDDLASLTKYNPRMANFSDDGETLTGAYGPRIDQQLNYVVHKLLQDPDTRQATLTTWTPNPKPSKDIPCTIAMDFKLRQDKLNMHVFMRSSDIWLGLPYDVFSFTMVAARVLAIYRLLSKRDDVELGALYLTAASSHLYQEYWGKFERRPQIADKGVPLPSVLYETVSGIDAMLFTLAESKKGDGVRWWERGLNSEPLIAR